MVASEAAMSISRVHYCISQERIAQGAEDPPAKKCRCRKFISIAEATRLVKVGEASWIVVSRKHGVEQINCRLCGGDPEVKRCAHCRGSGKETNFYEDDVYGNDIVYTSRDPQDKKEKKKRMWLAPKTPRTATIESEHIELAYVQGKKDAQDRIEEYGRLIIEARAFVGPKKISAIVPEPPDDRDKATGPTYDYGRSL
jgi:hypothetical protein